MSQQTKRRRGGLRGLDPAIVEFKRRAASNTAARTSRQKYDATRIRIRADAPEWVRDELDAVAGEVNTSRTQLSAFLWAWALTRFREGDEDLDEILHSSMIESRSINVAIDLKLDQLITRHQVAIAKSAEGAKCSA